MGVRLIQIATSRGQRPVCIDHLLQVIDVAVIQRRHRCIELCMVGIGVVEYLLGQ